MPVSALPKVKIDLTPGRGTVFVDGVKIPGVCEVSFSAKGQDVSRVTLVIIGDVEMSAEQAMVVMRYVEPPKADDTPAIGVIA